MGKVVANCIFFLFCQLGFSQADIFDVARKGTVAEMKSLIEKTPADINSVNNHGYSLLVLATYRGNNEVARFLIENGADINGTSNYGSPLMSAVVKGNLEIVKVLLEHKVDTNIADQSGNTALIYAVIFKNYDIAAMLVKAKADIAIKDIRGKSAMDYAKMNNDEKMMNLLKE
ncbi:MULTISPECIES: ankyrin repeat domain-containing protein [Flavobacterium]|uniref:ankyrin repeat domain-containing protein n=1 Tax=Flavobacterium TaxID=237 RepID=UPI001FCAE124|nr:MULTISPECIES: ankyrin repeat domain-containing protein [Flavobacterium]UOK42457.1 ankyrin repeat domain-containing protein [Flavobacterium enshiense]